MVYPCSNKYKDAGKLKPFLIFSMCDETFSLVYSTEAPEGVDKYWFMFFISLLNYIYWLMGSVLGGILGSMVEFNTKGLDFVLTALFVVIFLSHWSAEKNRKPALIGVLSSVVCLLIFGPEGFIIPAMITILVVLTVSRRKLVEGE